MCRRGSTALLADDEQQTLLPRVDSVFAQLDVNGDGVIDEDETEWLRDAIMDRATTMPARLGNQMRRLDANGDGKVSRDEFRARTLLFDRADRDGDGKLSAGELLVIRGILLNR